MTQWAVDSRGDERPADGAVRSVGVESTPPAPTIPSISDSIGEQRVACHPNAGS